jgi:plasmid stability protein
MASITIRNVDAQVKRGAQLVAAANGRSLEAELRDLLRRTYAIAGDERTARLRAMSPKDAVAHLIALAGGVGLDLPVREHEDIDFPTL